jgi:serine protease Do
VSNSWIRLWNLSLATGAKLTLDGQWPTPVAQRPVHQNRINQGKVASDLGLSAAPTHGGEYESECLPANLPQVRLDNAGAHAYERTHWPHGKYVRTNWTGLVRRAMTWVALLTLVVMVQSAPVQADEISRTFKRVTGSVVVIHTFERRTDTIGSDGEVSSTTAAGLGSGVLVSEDGLIATAAHVVQAADRVEVEFIDHQRIVAEVVASSGLDDVALLRLTLSPHGISPAQWGNSDSVEIGDPVFVIGAPYGLEHTLTAGRISGRRPRGGSELGPGSPQGELFQTDAAINRGNSGGPLFDEKGRLIGIVSFILSASGGFEGLGFAVTSNTVRRALIDNRAVWTGMTGVVLSGDLARALQLPQVGGYLVQQVARYSPAEAAGLKPGRIPAVIAGHALLLGGDIILSVDSIEVDGTPATSRRLFDHLAQRPAGSSVTLRVLRDGATQTVVSFVPR